MVLREQNLSVDDVQQADEMFLSSTLRDIVAAGGPTLTRVYLAPAGLYDRAGSVTGLSTVLRSPSVVLVEEMELVYPGGSGDPAVIAPPELR